MEAMCFPPPHVDYTTADRSLFDIRKADGSVVSFVNFTKKMRISARISTALLRNRCVRSMCRIIMVHTIKHRIKSKSLLERLGVGSFGSYYNRRLLRWAGHVACMPLNRMPRKLLTGWFEHARPVGCPQMTWGRTLKKALKSNDLPTDFWQWSALAADRMVWQQRIGVCPPCLRPATTLMHNKWRELFDGPARSL